MLNRIFRFCLFLLIVSTGLSAKSPYYQFPHRDLPLQRHFFSYPPDFNVYFDDHKICWAIGGGIQALLYETADGQVDESGLTGGIALDGGGNLPLVTFGENSGLGLNVVPSLSVGLGTLFFNSPVCLMYKFGQGSTYYANSNFSFGLGVGYGYRSAIYFDLFSAKYHESCPFGVVEIGGENVSFRLELMARHFKMDVHFPYYAEFADYALCLVHYIRE